MNAPVQIRKPIPRGPRGERGAINIPEIDGPFIQWQSPDGTWDDPTLRVNTLGPEGPSGDAQYFSTRSQAIAHNITTGLPAIKTYGYHTAGDGGGATYKLVTSGEDFSSADGQKWALAEWLVSVKMLGAKSDGTTPAQAAFTAAAAYSSHVMVPAGDFRISANTTFPRGVSWSFLEGARLIVDSGVTVIFNGVVHGGHQWMFAGDGSVVAIRSVWDIWFGVNGQVSQTTATSSTTITSGLGTKVFTVASTLRITNGVRIRAYSAAAPMKWMEGPATYSGTTLTIVADAIGATAGSASDWVIEANDSAALARMFACVQHDEGTHSAGGQLLVKLRMGVLPIGSMVTMTPTVYAQLRVIGAGRGLAGTLFQALPDFSGDAAIKISGNADATRALADFTIGGFTVQNAIGGNCSRGVLIGGDTGTLQALYGANLVHDVHVVNFQFGWLYRAARLVNLERCSANIEGVASATGLTFDTLDGLATGDCHISHFVSVCDIDNDSTGVALANAAAVGSSVAGITFSKLTVYAATLALDIHATSGYIGDIAFDTKCQFDGVGLNGIKVVGIGADVLITKIDFFGLWLNAYSSGYVFQATSGARVENCKVVDCNNNFVSGVGVLIDGCRGITIENMHFEDVNPGVGNAVIRLANTTLACRIANCTILKPPTGGGVAAYMVQVDVGSTWFEVHNNNTGNFAGMTQAVLDNSGSVTKVVANNQ